MFQHQAALVGQPPSDAIDAYVMISSLCVFWLATATPSAPSSAATSWTPAPRDRYRTMAGYMVVGYLTGGDG